MKSGKIKKELEVDYIASQPLTEIEKVRLSEYISKSKEKYSKKKRKAA